MRTDVAVHRAALKEFAAGEPESKTFYFVTGILGVVMLALTGCSLLCLAQVIRYW